MGRDKYLELEMNISTEIDKAVPNIESDVRIFNQAPLNYKKLSKDELLKHFTNINSAKYLFQMAIECCLDIGNHIISSEGYSSPSDYKDIFIILNKNKIIPDKFGLF